MRFNKGFYGDTFRWWYGIVDDMASDPLQLGRVRVRIYGIHSEEISANDLPWASVVAPTTSGGVSGVGTNPLLQPGARVIGFFLDGDKSQLPIVWGTIPNVEGQIRGSAPNNGGIAAGSNQGGPTYLPPADPNYIGDGYPPDMSDEDRRNVITIEANARSIDSNIAIEIYRTEGFSRYQSTAPRTGSGSVNGYEASYGPYQLFVGGGLGNEYERLTGRNLPTDNTREGIINQIRFALDRALTQGWVPWYGRANGFNGRGIGDWEGIPRGGSPLNNWR